MRSEQRRRVSAGATVAAMLALAASGPCIAQTPTESLRSCLATFEGIAWQLPYRPALQVHRCDVEADRVTLELIGALRLGPVRDRAPSDASRAQLQQAVFSHFDALFQRNGFRRVDEEPGEAEGERHVAKARYARGSQAPTLTWQTGAANTWLVTFDRAHAR